MQVSEAVASRRSVRAFLDTPVDLAVLCRVLGKAQMSPSGGNVQPWNAVVLTGKPLDAHRLGHAALGRKGPDQAKEFFVRGHTYELHRECGS